ncbi:MAG TPA: DMT family transporter, partial [Afifellaceae bacterium]|nr:DMT family transporter [Afifellaceae bacterium]
EAGMEGIAAGNLACALIMLAPVALVFGLPSLDPQSASATVLFAIIWLGAIGTGLSSVLRYYLARTVGYSFMALAAYMIPVAGVAISAVLLGETVSLTVLIALFLVLAGFAVARLGR